MRKRTAAMQGRSKSPYGNTEGIATLSKDTIALINVRKEKEVTKIRPVSNTKKGNR